MAEKSTKIITSSWLLISTSLKVRDLMMSFIVMFRKKSIEWFKRNFRKLPMTSGWTNWLKRVAIFVLKNTSVPCNKFKPIHLSGRKFYFMMSSYLPIRTSKRKLSRRAGLILLLISKRMTPFLMIDSPTTHYQGQSHSTVWPKKW